MSRNRGLYLVDIYLVCHNSTMQNVKMTTKSYE